MGIGPDPIENYTLDLIFRPAGRFSKHRQSVVKCEVLNMSGDCAGMTTKRRTERLFMVAKELAGLIPIDSSRDASAT